MGETGKEPQEVDAVVHLAEDVPVVADIGGHRVLLVPPTLGGDDLAQVLSKFDLAAPVGTGEEPGQTGFDMAADAAPGDYEPGDILAGQEPTVVYGPGDMAAVATDDTTVVYDPGDIIAIAPIDLTSLRDQA